MVRITLAIGYKCKNPLAFYKLINVRYWDDSVNKLPKNTETNMHPVQGVVGCHQIVSGKSETIQTAGSIEIFNPQKGSEWPDPEICIQCQVR